MAGIRPLETGVLVVHLVDSDDEDIVEAADEAMGMGEWLSELDDLDEE